jgi:hypothetical protein
VAPAGRFFVFIETQKLIGPLIKSVDADFIPNKKIILYRVDQRPIGL